MTHALNLTLPIKQDPETQAKLANLEAIFAEKVQPAIDAALRKSKLVHFARVVVIDNKYIQVITEYEGPHQEYTEFFRRELTPVFGAIFSLAEGVPDVSNANAFWEFSRITTTVRWVRRPMARRTLAAIRPAGCSRPTTT